MRSYCINEIIESSSIRQVSVRVHLLQLSVIICHSSQSMLQWQKIHSVPKGNIFWPIPWALEEGDTRNVIRMKQNQKTKKVGRVPFKDPKNYLEED